jgi:hypothetical protein
MHYVQPAPPFAIIDGQRDCLTGYDFKSWRSKTPGYITIGERAENRRRTVAIRCWDARVTGPAVPPLLQLRIFFDDIPICRQ